MPPLFLILVYCSLIAGASLAGGYLPTKLRLTHTRMQVLMSFVGGLMLGVALLHLLPHAAAEANSLDAAVACALVGLLAMFFLMRVSHFHQHPQGDEEHDDHHHQEHGPHHATSEGLAKTHQFSWMGLFCGLALHTLIDGMALAASVAIAGSTGAATGLVGSGTFLAILMHKPLDALSITSLMVSASWSPGWIKAINLIFALMCPIGALVFYYSMLGLGESQGTVVGWSLGFAAGVFLCISLADILPEVQFHRHDRVKLSSALLFGVTLAYAIGFLEPAHEHVGTDPSPDAHSLDHGH
jgi:zinc and cadmium transporter